MSKTPARADKRTTVSLAWVIWDMAEEMMTAKGFNDNFSAYVADLIRRDKERKKRNPTPLGKASHIQYPSPPDQLNEGAALRDAPASRPNTKGKKTR